MTRAPKSPPSDKPDLRPFLEQLYSNYHDPEWIGSDPLAWPRRYREPRDREVAAFLASSLAYGNVRQIDRSLEELFGRMGESPYDFARNFSPGRSDEALRGFYHRFNPDRDLAALIHLIGQMLRSHGSIEGFWKQAQRTKEEREQPIAVQAGRFMDAALRLDAGPYYPNLTRGDRSSLLYLLPDVSGPSACKRFFLFLRWVVRPEDGVDLGLWSCLSPSQLEYPVDTHILRLSRYLGATRRNDAGARTRTEITEFFRSIDPADPVRFDFSICRLGIEKVCPSRANLAQCESCGLRPVCLRHEALGWNGRLPRRLARLDLLKSAVAASRAARPRLGKAA